MNYITRKRKFKTERVNNKYVIETQISDKKFIVGVKTANKVTINFDNFPKQVGYKVYLHSDLIKKK